MFGLGFSEILIILVLVLILFGAGKLPQVMGDFGKGLKSFKDEMEGAKATTKPKTAKAKVFVKKVAAQGKSKAKNRRK